VIAYDSCQTAPFDSSWDLQIGKRQAEKFTVEEPGTCRLGGGSHGEGYLPGGQRRQSLFSGVGAGGGGRSEAGALGIALALGSPPSLGLGRAAAFLAGAGAGTLPAS
jgi:hypothetical protein